MIYENETSSLNSIKISKYINKNIKNVKRKYLNNKIKEHFKKYYDNSYIIPIIIIQIIILIGIFYKINFFHFLKEKILNINNDRDIIDSKNYIDFEKIKLRFSNNSFLYSYLVQINIISHIYQKNLIELKNNKNNVHICMSFNDVYIYPILVSVESVLINCNKNKTFVTYHFLCTPDVKNNTISILKSLMNRYSTNLEMIFYDMGNTFINHIPFRLSQSTYYRLLAPIIFDIERIIFLDGDTLGLKDLSEMYQAEFNENYVLGFLDIATNGVDHLGIKSEKFINAGVILLNLEKIRNDNKTFDLIQIIDNNISLPQQDQTIINYIFYPKIGILPSKYSIWNFHDKLDIEKYLSRIRTKLDINELENSLNDTCILHITLCWPKIWKNNSRYNFFTACKQRGNCDCRKYQDLWYAYARKTEYYNQILNYTKYVNY